MVKNVAWNPVIIECRAISKGDTNLFFSDRRDFNRIEQKKKQNKKKRRKNNAEKMFTTSHPMPSIVNDLETEKKTLKNIHKQIMPHGSSLCDFFSLSIHYGH